MVVATSIGRFSTPLSHNTLMHQNKTKSQLYRGGQKLQQFKLKDSSYTKVVSIVAYSRKVFTAYILIISDAAEKLHLAAELKSRY